MTTTAIEPVKIPAKAKRQIEYILETMGPYSVSKLLEAIEAGHIDGTIWDNYANWDYTTDTHRTTETFRGCLIGWAGFLEKRVRRETYRLAVKNHHRAKRDPHTPECLWTGEGEAFISKILPGSTPQNNAHSAAFRDLVVKFQARQVVKKEVENA